MFPILFDIFRAADAIQLIRFQIGRFGQKHIGVPIRFVGRVGERGDERKFRHLLRDRFRIPV